MGDCLACPFCHRATLHTVRLSTGGGYAVRCFDCRAAGPWGRNPEEALILWDQRDKPAAPAPVQPLRRGTA